MAAVQELDRVDGNPGSFVAFSEREGLDLATDEAVVQYSDVLAEFRILCLERAARVEQVTTESE